MTVVVVPYDPPASALSRLSETAPVSSAEATDLYRAMVADTFLAVDRSGGDLLVNYPDPGRAGAGDDPETAARELAAEAGVDVDAARFEVQVGSSVSARAGNAVTHLLDAEEVNTAAVVPGDAPFLVRTDVDSAAMKLRSDGVVLGPTDGGGVYFAGFAAPIDFADAYAPPALLSLVERARDAGHGVALLRQQTRVRTGRDLAGVLTELRARRVAGLPVPERTAAALDDLDVDLGVDADGAVSLTGATDTS